MTSHWQDARWPLSGDALYRSERGDVRIEGNADRYRVELSARVEGTDVPATALTAQGTGNTAGLAISQMTAALLGGTIHAQGTLGWAGAVSWNLNVQAENVDPGQKWQEWPGRLSAQATTTGSLPDEQAVARIDIARLSGDLRGSPVEAVGRMELQGPQLAIPAMTLRSGDNRFKLAGRIRQDRFDLNVDVDAPDLRALHPELAGRIGGTLLLAGSLDDPQIEAHLSGAGLRFQSNSVGRIKLDIAPEQAHQQQFSGRITIADLASEAANVERADLTIAGSLLDHRVSVQAASKDLGSLDMALVGGYRQATWTGRLERTGITLARLPETPWTLAAPVDLLLGADRAEWGQACFAASQGELCSQGRWSAETGLKADAKLTDIPYQLFSSLLPDDVAIEGVLDASAQAETRNGRLAAHAEIRPGDGAAVFKPVEVDGQPLRLPWRDARLIVDWQADAADLEWTAGIAEQGKLDGRLRLDLSAAPDDPGMAGQATLHFPDLALIAPLLPQVENLTGALEADAKIGGRLSAPRVEGKARVLGASARLPELGLDLKGIELTAQNRGTDAIAFQGQASSGKGQVRMEGTAQLDPDQGWPVQATLSGKDFEISRLPEAEATISPDLSLTSRAGGIEATGKVVVPRLHIQLKELPAQAAAPSRDEVIVGVDAGSAGEAKPPGLKVTSRIEVELGDDVSFEGFGLTTGLGGNLRLRTRPDQPPYAEGELTLKKGRYKAYGQNLTLERGTLLFAGPPDNPRLDLRAVRKAGEVTAGIEIQGTLKTPESRVFSEPAMSEAEALAYLLTGRPLSGSSTAGGVALGQAALALGLKNSESITREIAQTIGVDELSLSGGEEAEESSLLVGKYLTPDLYLRYSYGLFDSQGKVTLRYDLTKSLSVEAHSGAAQGMDLLYSIERD